MIPEFDERGSLPPGIHDASWDEIVTRYATNTRRGEMLDGLLDALHSLRAAGCGTAYLDGSFVTANEHPGDFDACWEASGVDPARLDGELLDFSDVRAAQKARYGGELFPWRRAPSQPARRSLTTFNATARAVSPRASSQSLWETFRDHQRAPVPHHQGRAQPL